MIYMAHDLRVKAGDLQSEGCLTPGRHVEALALLVRTGTGHALAARQQQPCLGRAHRPLR